MTEALQQFFRPDEQAKRVSLPKTDLYIVNQNPFFEVARGNLDVYNNILEKLRSQLPRLSDSQIFLLRRKWCDATPLAKLADTYNIEPDILQEETLLAEKILFANVKKQYQAARSEAKDDKDLRDEYETILFQATTRILADAFYSRTKVDYEFRLLRDPTLAVEQAPSSTGKPRTSIERVKISALQEKCDVSTLIAKTQQILTNCTHDEQELFRMTYLEKKPMEELMEHFGIKKYGINARLQKTRKLVFNAWSSISFNKEKLTDQEIQFIFYLALKK